MHNGAEIVEPTQIRNVYGFIRHLQMKLFFLEHIEMLGYGAMDRISDTTSLMENWRLHARAFSAIYKKGWRLKRNIQFASWGAEECDLIGTKYDFNMTRTMSFMRNGLNCIIKR
eukprot:930474_1